MGKVRCKNCGKSYPYETNGCCPECGAYNRPPHRREVHADGAVYGTEYAEDQHIKGNKVCYEQKTCYEKDARRVRFEGERLKTVLKKLCLPMEKHGKGKEIRIAPVLIVLAALLFGMLVNTIDFDISWFGAGGSGDIAESDYVDVGDYFTLDGQEMYVTDLQVMEESLCFTLVGGAAYTELWVSDEDDVQCELCAQDEALLSEGPIMRYSFSLEDIYRVEKLTLGFDEEIQIDLDILRVEEGDYFYCWGEEVRVVSHNLQRQGSSRVVDDNILTVEIEGKIDNALLPELWFMTEETTPWTLQPESREDNLLHYNLGSMEPQSVTLCVPCGDKESCFVWMTLE